MDDKEKLKDLERKKLLEEIRKRAEAAELKRIEEGEEKANLTSSPVASPESLPPPVSSSSLPLRSSDAPGESRIKALRERFSIAIERGKSAKAEDLLQEISALVTDKSEVDSLREQLEDLRREQLDDAKARKQAVEHKPKPEAKSRAQREAEQKKIAALFEKANNYYQSEKYEKGLESLNELFTLDGENEDAKQLAADIAKARELADRIREEESKRRAAEASSATPPPPEPPSRPQAPGDVWGNKETPRPEVELGLPTVAEEVAAPPKPPLSERLVEGVTKIRIPLKPVLIGVGVLVLAASVYFIVDSLKQAVFPPKYSLLVLPAMGTSTDSSTQFLASAVTGDLITTVSSVKDLRVIAPVTAISLGLTTNNPSQVARSLGASFFLQWTVSQTDDKIAFQLTLSDTVSTKPVWSSQRQNSARELQSAITEIARAMVREMKIEEGATLAVESNTSQEAYEAYARGRWYLRRGDFASVSIAIGAFAEALERDPRFEEARLAIAWAHLLIEEFDVDTTSAHVNQAWSHLNEALALGARSSESHRIRGLIALHQSQYDRAVDELERGAARSPSDAETQRRLATLYVIRGRTDDAVKAALHALSDDPRNVDSYTVLGMTQHFREEELRVLEKSSADEYREALQSFEQGMRYSSDKGRYMSEEFADMLHYTHQSDRAAQILESRVAQTQQYTDYYRLGRLYQTAGRAKQLWEEKLLKAKSLLEGTVAANPLDAQAYSYLALVETRLGTFKNALEANARARQLAPLNVDVLYNTARMYALQIDKTRAFDYLSKAIDRRYRLSSILDMDFYNLRSEPEFQQTITR